MAELGHFYFGLTSYRNKVELFTKMDTIITDSAAAKIEESFIFHKDGNIYRSVIEDTERILIEKALQHSEGNQLTAAKLLGINRNTLRSKIRKLNIDQGKFKYHE